MITSPQKFSRSEGRKDFSCKLELGAESRTHPKFHPSTQVGKVCFTQGLLPSKLPRAHQGLSP